MATSAHGSQQCNVNYEASYIYETFGGGDMRPKISKCSRPALKDGKCILHGKTIDRKLIELDEALVYEVTALGIPEYPLSTR